MIRDNPDKASEDVVAIAFAIFILCVIFGLASVVPHP